MTARATSPKILIAEDELIVAENIARRTSKGIRLLLRPEFSTLRGFETLS